MRALIDNVLRRVNGWAGWLGPALARLTLGVVFIQSGWGKLHNLPKVIEFFTSLHLPAPSFQAHLVATTELVGGALVLVGLLTRLASIPLAVTMVVALLTAKSDDIHGVADLLGVEEWSYLVMLIWLMVAGPGALSVDRLLARVAGTQSHAPASPPAVGTVSA